MAQSKNPSGNMVSFETLTKLIRHCSYTEEKAENIGWINTDILDDVSSINSSEEDENPLEELLPLEQRKNVSKENMKPGDILLIQSSRGYHLIKVEDVMLETYIIQRKS